MKIRSKSRKKRTILLTALVVVLLLGAGTAYAATTHVGPFTNSNHDDSKISSENSNKDNDTDATDDADNDADVDSNVEEHVENGGGSGQNDADASGGVKDTEGSNVDTSSDGVSSKSGNITLYSPTSNQKIANGSAIKGSAKVSTVFYRVSDNVHGMIGSGQLSVKNGKFSGKLAANTNASSGMFEVYSFNNQGQEVNNIRVNVSY